MARRRATTSPLDDFGNHGVTDEDRDYQGSRYAQVKAALFANPYQKVWGAPGEAAFPRYDTSTGPRRLKHACVRTVDTRADLRWGVDRKGSRRLVHPNGICLTGTWTITEENGFSGYFQKGRQGLVIARASTGRADINEGTLRTLGLAGKLYPTLDEQHDALLQPAHFFVQDTLSGTRFARVTDVAMTNAPSVRLFDNVEDITRTLRVGRIFREVDDETAVRQLYEIAELDPRPGEVTNVPQFMRLTAAAGQPPQAEADFRDEILAHIFDRGDPTPRRAFAFDIAVANDGTRVGDLFTGRQHVVTSWQPIGRLTFTDAVVSYNGDFVLHFHHPPFRRDRNDPRTVVRVDGKKTESKSQSE